MAKQKFTVKLLALEGYDSAALKPPFYVVAVFDRKGRIPVKGTINGFPFRSSLMNMGDGHIMAVNAKMREGAQCKAGDTVAVEMEVDNEKRIVELPKYLKKMIHGDPEIKRVWDRLAFTHQKEHVQAIEDAKKPETRKGRIDAMMVMLRERQAKNR
jgi:hypothetical protein